MSPFAEHLRNLGYQPRTITNYADRVTRAERAFQLDCATPAQLKEYWLTQKPTATNRNGIRCALIAYFDWKGTKPNPAKELPVMKRSRGLPRPVEHPEALLEVARGLGLRDEMLVTVYLYTGLRLNEVRSLTWPQLQESWAILIQKGGQERRVFLSTEVRRVLEQWREVCPSDVWLLPSPRNTGPISDTWILRRIALIGRLAQVEKCRTHRLRHTFATRFYRLTKDILATQLALGHASIGSTMIYLEPPSIEASMEQLSFKEKPSPEIDGEARTLSR